MKQIHVSTQEMGKFAGRWVVIDPTREMIIAVGDSPEEISSLVVHGVDEKILPVGTAPYSFLVPRKDEGPYVLWTQQF